VFTALLCDPSRHPIVKRVLHMPCSAAPILIWCLTCLAHGLIKPREFNLEVPTVSGQAAGNNLRQVAGNFDPCDVVYHAIHHKPQLLGALRHSPDPRLEESRLIE